MAARYALIFAAIVAAAAGCCFPDKYLSNIEIHSASASNNINLTTQSLKYAYDSIKDKIMIDYLNGRKIIYDYSNGIFYNQINSTYCVGYNIRVTNIRKQCLNTITGKAIGHYNLGAGKLPFTVYGQRNVRGSSVFGWLWSLSKGCLPITSAGYNNHSMGAYVSITTWTNMKLEFNSTVVFQPSQHCSRPTSSKRYNIQFDLMDEINSKSGRPLSKKEAKVVSKIDKYVDEMEMKRQQEKLRYEEEMRMRQEERRRQQERKMYERMAELESEKQDYDDNDDDDFDWE